MEGERYSAFTSISPFSCYYNCNLTVGTDFFALLVGDAFATWCKKEDIDLFFCTFMLLGLAVAMTILLVFIFWSSLERGNSYIEFDICESNSDAIDNWHLSVDFPKYGITFLLVVLAVFFGISITDFLLLATVFTLNFLRSCLLGMGETNFVILFYFMFFSADIGDGRTFLADDFPVIFRLFDESFAFIESWGVFWVNLEFHTSFCSCWAGDVPMDEMKGSVKRRPGPAFSID